MACSARNSPGACPVCPQDMMNSPSQEYFTTRLFPLLLWPSAMKTLPLSATTTSLGELKL